MAKKRRQSEPDDDDAIPAEAPDRLGKLMACYRVSMVGTIVVSLIGAAAGVGCILFALSREQIPLILLGVGAALALGGLVLPITNAFNAGRCLEIRKKGIRFTEAGVVTEMRWEAISTVDVSRTDETYMGPITEERRSKDTFTPSGLLTNTDWEVTIVGGNDDVILITKSFLRTIPDARKVINQIKLRAGV